MLSLLLASCLMGRTTAAFNSTTFFLSTKFDSMFDMHEAYRWSSNDVYKNSRSSRIEKEWLGDVPLSLKNFNDQILDPFLRILSRRASTRRDETRVFFPTEDKLQIQCRYQRKSFERISMKWQVEDTCSQVNQ